MRKIVEIYQQMKVRKGESRERLITRNLKARLQRPLGKKLTFWSSLGKTELVFSDMMPTGSAVEWALELSEMSAKENPDEDMETVKKCAIEIRKEITNSEKQFDK